MPVLAGGEVLNPSLGNWRTHIDYAENNLNLFKSPVCHIVRLRHRREVHGLGEAGLQQTKELPPVQVILGAVHHFAANREKKLLSLTVRCGKLKVIFNLANPTPGAQMYSQLSSVWRSSASSLTEEAPPPPTPEEEEPFLPAAPPAGATVNSGQKSCKKSPIEQKYQFYITRKKTTATAHTNRQAAAIAAAEAITAAAAQWKIRDVVYVHPPHQIAHGV